MLDDWLDFLYQFKWSLIIIQVFIIFLTSLCLALHDTESLLENKRILLITAHPDDESMFFIPLLSYFRAFKIDLLCLTNGNSENLGRVREKELTQAASFLNIKNLTIIDKPSLPDSMSVVWDTAEVKKTISEYLKNHPADCIFSFDEFGVSGHTNHIAIYLALKELKPAYPAVQIFALESSNLIRKYIGLADIVVSSRSEYSALNFNPFFSWRAMSIHYSQFVWYRRLFVLFSRYTYFNTFKLV